MLTNLRILKNGLWIQYAVDKITNNYFTGTVNRPCKVVVNSYILTSVFLVCTGENLEAKNGKLVIKKLGEEDLGVYACFDTENNLLQEFEVSLGLR